MVKTVANVFLMLLAVSLTACGTTKNLHLGSPLAVDDNSGILVIGLRPNYKIHLTRGLSENGVWARPRIDIPEINVTPEDGYIIVKALPTTGEQVLGVSLVFPGGGAYGPCQGSESPTFQVKAGAV